MIAHREPSTGGEGPFTVIGTPTIFDVVLQVKDERGQIWQVTPSLESAEEYAEQLNAAYCLGHSAARAEAANEIANAAYAEREACCAILASAEPNTTAEQLVQRMDRLLSSRDIEIPDEVESLLRRWCAASANELSDFQKLFRARGEAPPLALQLEAERATNKQLQDELSALRQQLEDIARVGL